MKKNNYFENEKLKTNVLLFEELQNFEKNGSYKNENEVIKIVSSKLNIPEIDKYNDQLLNPFIVQQYIIDNIDGVNHDLYKEKSTILSSVYKHRLKSKDYLRIRTFDSENGLYYPKKVLLKDCAYNFYNLKPYLLTLVKNEWIQEQSEIGFIVRPEIRLLSAIASSVGDDRYCVFLLNHNTIDIPSEYALLLGQFFSNSFFGNIEKLLLILSAFRRQGQEKPIEFQRKYSYIDTENISFEYVKQFYDNFDINDELQLRTGYLFLKSGMLFFSNRAFMEDALITMYIGLEGCLHIISNKYLNRKFNIDNVVEFIKRNLGKYYYDEAIKEFYDNRVILVHPENRISKAWSHFLQADDVYDSYGYLLSLYFFSITKKYPSFDDTQNQ